MKVNPVPSVAITQADGSTLTMSPAAPGGTVLGQPFLVLDTLSASWGRATFTDHAESQTAKFSVLWPAGFGRDPGSILLDWDDWHGQPVIMSWRDPASGTVRRFFRGKISDVALRPRTPDSATPGRAPTPRGAVVDVVAMGILTDVANRQTQAETWGEESGDARMNRLRALTSDIVPTINYRAYWGGAIMSQRTVNGTSALDLLQAMYDTAGGDRLTYDPDANAISYVRRRSIAPASELSGQNYRARLRRDNTLYPGQVHISAHSANASWPMLDAHWIEGTSQLAKSAAQRITRIVTHWTESAGTAPKTSVLYNPPAEASGGVRGMDLQTELRDAPFATQCTSDWWSIVTAEGQNAVADPMVYRADLAGGFDTLAAAQLLIGGTELSDPAISQGGANLVFIAGSIYQAMRLDSVWGIIGGEIKYTPAGWVATCNTARAFWELSPGMGYLTPVALSALKANSTQDAFTLRDLAHSITWNDLRSVGSW